MMRPSLLLLALWTMVSCSGTTDPEIRSGEDLRLMRLEPNHPEYFNTEVRLWAKPGQEIEGSLSFKDPEGGRGEAYVRLRIGSASLERFPDGSAMGSGDSLLITLRLVNPESLLLEALPSGLRFRSGEPARLTVEYTHCDLDLNGDRVRDDRDAALLSGLAVWSQEQLDGPFSKLRSINHVSLNLLEAYITGFSRLAVAY